tara:strand:- start:2561 stop:3466 length:906 start_codon:yes stop_codon:yes gene_type:complete
MIYKLISIVIRTLNEEMYLNELLYAVKNQILEDLEYEIVIIDSGSTDKTLEIAKKHECRVTSISKKDFSFGRSLNMGSKYANGDILVYISGHCIPSSQHWLYELVKPIISGHAGYSYGGQLGKNTTKFSEKQLFKKYFPNESEIPQKGFFCNNANSAISRKVWEKYSFNEEITGLEDMELAKRYTCDGGMIAYVYNASVFHIHNETWKQTRRRYERESFALQEIMPELRMSLWDMWRYIFVGIKSDFLAAIKKKSFFNNFLPIILFRTAQYFGSYRGNKLNKQISDSRKEAYFYPKRRFRE